MGKTIRWYQKLHNKIRNRRIASIIIRPWKEINPYYFRHEIKEIRVKIHRQVRRNNKIRLKKGLDIEPEQKTRGWITY